MSASPKITVVIPVYNRASYVAAAIDSILAQSCPDFEVLLIDDGSTDDSVEVMQAYGDPRLRLICNERNLGIPRTRNKGLVLARGQYVAMLDSDDSACPSRLAMQAAFLDQHPDYAVVGSWVAVSNDQHQSARKIGILPVSSPEVQSRLLFHCSLSQSTVMARTDILRAYRYREDYTVCSDFDLWVRLARRYKLGNLPHFLVHRKLHAGRVTVEKARLVKSVKQDIFRSQLLDLGAPFSEEDVERHFLLLRMKNARFIPDYAYLDWAEGWLRSLQTANQRSACYPNPAFIRVTAEMWLAVCWQAATRLGWAAWRHFWRSPLSWQLWPSIKKYLWLWTLRRFP